jgi:hypothetical protein
MKTALPLSFAVLLLSAAARTQEDTVRPDPNPSPERAAPTAAAPAPAVADVEARFQATLTNATLTGRWAPLREGVLGEERGGDSYQIVGVTKVGGDTWVVRSKLQYREREFVLPIPVQVRFAGDTAILMVDKLTIPDGGTYSARVMFYEHTYSGMWTGGRGGGLLYGVITNAKE